MPANNFEQRLLRMMRGVLVDVVKDTTTAPGHRHPLTERTRNQIRDCLELISLRQRDNNQAEGIAMDERPRYIDEPRKSVVVDLDPKRFNRGKKRPDSSD